MMMMPTVILRRPNTILRRPTTILRRPAINGDQRLQERRGRRERRRLGILEDTQVRSGAPPKGFSNVSHDESFRAPERRAAEPRGAILKRLMIKYTLILLVAPRRFFFTGGRGREGDP